MDRLEAAYKNAKETGLWKGTYAISDVHEYWAEGVQSWFDTNRHDDNQHNHVDTREELETYDPLLYKLIAETFRRTDWRYTRPDQRKDPAHLAGFDRANAPEFRWQRERKTSPKVSASFTSPSDRVEDAVDRKTEFSPEPRNRWTSDGSPNAEDWLALEFAEEPTIDRIEISIYDDGKTVLAPKAYRIEVGDGKEWRDVADVVKTPDEPKGGVVNIATFPPVKASHLRVIFTNQERAKSGVTEIEIREK